MQDPHFARFIGKCGAATQTVQIPDASLSKWAGKLPPLMLHIWQEEGWASYGNGRFWLVNPDNYEHIKDAWLQGTPLATLDTFHVIARGAFGDLYLCGEKTGVSVTVVCILNEILAQTRRLKPKTPQDQDHSVRVLLSVGDPEGFDYSDTDGTLLFDRAVNKYGPLAPDEMYGFEPALVLGGSPTLDNLRRLKLDPHLLTLRGFATPRVPLALTGMRRRQ